MEKFCYSALPNLKELTEVITAACNCNKSTKCKCFKAHNHTQPPETLYSSSHSLAYPYTAEIETSLSYAITEELRTTQKAMW